MELTKEQVEALADRFDDIAYSVARALELSDADDARRTCDRLKTICQALAHNAPHEQEDEVGLHFVAALLAAVEVRYTTPFDRLWESRVIN